MSRELHLLPHAGQPFLESDDLLRRLRAEFVFVETSHELGAAKLELVISRWERTNPIVFEAAGAAKGTGPQLKAEHLEKLRAALPHACYVRFGDDDEHAHGHLMSIPSDGILLVAESEWQGQLAERCARCTGYVMHDI